jgi:uncharacterized protein YkwD
MNNRNTIHTRIFCLSIVLLVSSCSISRDLKHKSSYEKYEIKQLRKCNTARLSWYMSPNAKRIILLSNLLRTDPLLFSKYLHLQTDSLYYENKIVTKKIEKRALGKLPEKTPTLKPSFNLALASKIHSIHSGLNGQIGHQHLTLRMRITLNTNLFYGENCYYDKTDAYGAIVGWIESTGHYQNIINPGFYRIGVSGFWHREYDKNYVQVFSGKKWRDHVGL